MLKHFYHCIHDIITKPPVCPLAGAQRMATRQTVSQAFKDHFVAGLDLQMYLQGTPAFMAPEVFDRAFGLPADMWSMGMLAYQGIANRCAEATAATCSEARSVSLTLCKHEPHSSSLNNSAIACPFHVIALSGGALLARQALIADCPAAAQAAVLAQ